MPAPSALVFFRPVVTAIAATRSSPLLTQLPLSFERFRIGERIPHFVSRAGAQETRVVRHVDARRLKSGYHHRAVEVLADWHLAKPVEDQVFHRVASECRCLKAVHLSVIEVPAQVSLRAPKTSPIVFVHENRSDTVAFCCVGLSECQRYRASG